MKTTDDTPVPLKSQVLEFSSKLERMLVRDKEREVEKQKDRELLEQIQKNTEKRRYKESLKEFS